jgi:hypothetical protein
VISAVCLLLEEAEEDQNLIHSEALSSSDSFPFRDMCTKCYIRLPEIVFRQGDNKNTTQITPFLRRNNFVPMNEVIFCRSRVKRRFMGRYLSSDTKEKFEAVFV